MVDEFILFDDVQFTRRDWRNRNMIKTPNGSIWLTIPVEVKGKYEQKISETKISDKNWAKKHWTTICHNYSKSKCFREYKEVFEDLYLNSNEEYLSEINYRFITAINNILGIKTKISFSSDYKIIDGKTERLIDLCKKAGATEYISGLSAKSYINESLFESEQIKLTWMDYSNYNEYEQLYPPFVHEVSIVDLILNEGGSSVKFMKTFK